MATFELPANLVRATREVDDANTARRRAWITELPAIVDALARRWSIEIGAPFQPGGVASWVAPVRKPTGDHIVLKVGWLHEEARHEADGLRAWDGAGAVRLLDALVAGETSALLLEACEPGTPLSLLLPADEQDVVVAGLLRRMWIHPPAGHPFRPLQQMCELWADEFEEKYAASGRTLELDPGVVRQGIALFRELPAAATDPVLLCTDLHPENVLAAQREPWLVIDPKPYLGDRSYDALQHMLNFPARLLADPRRFVRRMAGLLDLDAEHLGRWLFARCVQESLSLDMPHARVAAALLAP